MKGNKKIQTQEQITISAYDMEVIQKSFISTLKWLEFYIEKSGYSGNWKRQISETIKRDDLNQPSEIKRFMETALLALDGMIENKPDFILENLQEKFYSWLAESGIRVDDCPEGLVECLVDIHKVLNNEGKEFGERVDKEASEGIARMTPEERRQKFRQTLNAAQRMMDVAREREGSLEGKTYKDVETKNQFSGNSDQGKEIFSQIKSQQSVSSDNVSLKNEIIQDVKANPQNWRLDEVITELGNLDEAKQEWVLIHKDAREDYNHEGKLNFNNNPIYRWENFTAREKFEVKQAKNLLGDYSTNEEIKWIVKEVKSNPNIWKIRKIDGQNYLIHASAQMKENEIGTLIHNEQKFSEAGQREINRVLESRSVRRELLDNIFQNQGKWEVKDLVVSHSWHNGKWNKGQPESVLIRQDAEKIEYNQSNGDLVIQTGKMYKVRDLTEAEKTEIGIQSNRLEVETKQSFINQPSEPKNDNSIGTGGIIASVAGVSALVVGGVVVIKKKLNKKNKG